MCEWMSDHGMEVTITPVEEWKNLPVDPITATGGPLGAQEREVSEGNLFQTLVKALATRHHSLPPPSCPLNMSEQQFRHTITLSGTETAQIIAQMRKMGVTISVLLQAANALAQIKMNPIPPPA
ncbi:hypothetical protein JVU11DRAFT_8330 [Chiua virens]|nr:hypothetical protein JVU11DRAFT_8330 [Chiua virens]